MTTAVPYMHYQGDRIYIEHEFCYAHTEKTVMFLVALEEDSTKKTYSIYILFYHGCNSNKHRQPKETSPQNTIRCTACAPYKAVHHSTCQKD